MGKQWYSSISDDLAEVDRIIRDTLRSDRKDLQDICDYVTSSGGKKVRPAMCILAHHACGGTRNDDVLKIAAAFEMIHDATLIHDDINDKSEIRRGRTTVHEKYTVTKAVILGDLMFAMGFKLMGSADTKIIDTVARTSTAMAESEFIQKEFEHTPIVTEDDYLKIIRGKTAMPIFACARAGAYIAGADEDTINEISWFALDVGLAFQIVDDVLDIIGDHRVTGKEVGMDIAEGKPTLPIIYAMEDPVSGSKIKRVFKKRNASAADLEKALELIRGTDAVERCLAKAKEIVENAVSHLPTIKESEYKDSLIGLARYIVCRDR
ncbi:MAG: polyprenyl synthetase family protein [Methanomassiliicoccaceae archaeon]|jgi:octaprenyl-diphosphate synthase|nr:polyprenyl synthetase family protein [Methanomassiliicoccaceae archaeon]